MPFDAELDSLFRRNGAAKPKKYVNQTRISMGLKIRLRTTSVSHPDLGSGFKGLLFWIRIRNPDPDPGD